METYKITPSDDMWSQRKNRLCLERVLFRCLEKQVGSRAVGWGITGKQSGARIRNNIERLLENSYFVLYL